MKVILCFILIILFGFIGYGIASFYIVRKKFFFSLNVILQKLKAEINFSSKKLLDLINESIEQTSDKNIKKFLQNYKQAIQSDINFERDGLFEGINFLTLQEQESLFVFFKGLGRVDTSSQTEIISAFENTTSDYYDLAKNESKKYASLYTKLGIILGAFVALLIA